MWIAAAARGRSKKLREPPFSGRLWSSESPAVPRIVRIWVIAIKDTAPDKTPPQVAA